MTRLVPSAADLPTGVATNGRLGTTTVALVEEYPVVAVGVAQMLHPRPEISFRGAFTDVAELLSTDERVDVVLLALRLPDGSEPGANVGALQESGSRVVVFTGGDSPYLLRLAADAGVAGVVRKTADGDLLARAVVAVARGEEVPAAARPERPPVLLSRRECETLALYAAGEKSERVAARLGISRETVNDYIGRARAKYRGAGRQADTKIDLYKRAVEDGILPGPGLPGA
ncbi:response regulator transcription factor [Georgenia subflava]|uniref:DNA-binding response regulator n=1 Tax=Georgenia subflava TaxID=1622177 RepID=A0A6N7EPY3_9MICO|nr:LuxR C-terminal-related transcriptional regulator [Georgenia subflava]MPV39183.1 DNA-binding response regulator [Georgenia subflava]